MFELHVIVKRQQLPDDQTTYASYLHNRCRVRSSGNGRAFSQ